MKRMCCNDEVSGERSPLCLDGNADNKTTQMMKAAKYLLIFSTPGCPENSFVWR